MKRVAGRLKGMGVGDRLVRRLPLFFGPASALFEELESVSLDERQRFTEERLRVVLFAAAGTRYGRSLGAGTALDGWPLLEKEDVRDDPEAFVTRRRLATVPASTSGTTGTPLKLRRSLRSVVVEQAAIDRLARAKEVDLARARVAVLRGDDLQLPGRGTRFWKDVAGRRRIFSSNDLGPETVDLFTDALEDFAPDCLLAYPTVLESLCHLLEPRGRSVVIPLTLTSSEVLSTPARRLAGDILQTDVVDYYGQAERVNFAYSFDEGEYRFLPGYGITELVLVGEGDHSDLYEIVGTPLWNTAMPLIRYRTGDLVRLPKNLSLTRLEAICYGAESIPGIIGRDGDFLVAPNGGHLMGIDHIPRDVENVLRLQVIQESRSSVRILVLPKSGFSKSDQDQIAENARRKLPPTMQYSIELVDSLERTSQLKTPLVIRRPGLHTS